MITKRALMGYLHFFFLFMLMLSCCIVNGETSYLGEKLLSYVDDLPDSYSLIYTIITPVNDENYNYFANETDSPNCPVANIEIILYARTPDNRLIEKYSMMYDMSVLKNLLRTIKVGNQKESHYYFPKGNACQIDESYVMLYEESYTIMDFINPLAGKDWLPELRDYIKTNYITKGNEIRFPANTEPVFDNAFIMPDNPNLCPPIQKIDLDISGNDEKSVRKISINSVEYNLSNGTKVIFPRNMIMSWGKNDKYKSYFEVIRFDTLKDDIKDALFTLDIPDGAEIRDNRLNLTYTKNAQQPNKTEVNYPTKFTYFGLSFEQVKALIDNKINEDRLQNAQYIK